MTLFNYLLETQCSGNGLGGQDSGMNSSMSTFNVFNRPSIMEARGCGAIHIVAWVGTMVSFFFLVFRRYIGENVSPG